MDRKLRCDAGLALAGCVPRQRSRRAEGAGGNPTGAGAAPERVLASLAFLRRHASVEQCLMLNIVYFDRVPSPLGEMLLASDGDALSGAWFAGQRPQPPI